MLGAPCLKPKQSPVCLLGGGAHLPQHVTIQRREPQATPHSLQGLVCHPLSLIPPPENRPGCPQALWRSRSQGGPSVSGTPRTPLNAGILTARLAEPHQKLLLYPDVPRYGYKTGSRRFPPPPRNTQSSVSTVHRPGPGALLKGPKNLWATSENDHGHPGRTLGPGCPSLSAGVPGAGSS